ncbi:MAG: hypothetical protein QHH74_10510 [Spirochaetota bacterium]|nr:hypothetical protein [Spirochaetota bacterium]
MLCLTHKLSIGGYNFPAVNQVNWTSSREGGDTITIKLPKYKRLSYRAIPEGTKVEFWCGYTQYGMNLEFEGFVREVSPTQPFTIIAEDYFYFLRREVISKTFTNMTCGEIIKYICSPYPIDTGYIHSGIKIKNRNYFSKTKRFIVKDLATLCGFDVFFVGSVLHFEKPFSMTQKSIPVFTFGKNVIEDDIYFSPDPEYDKIILISEQTDGSGMVYTAQYGNGQRVKTMYIEDIPQNEIKSRAKELYDEITYNGFKGSIITFGYPSVMHSTKVKITDDRYPEKNGYYYVDKVEKEYGSNGFRQKIYIGKKAS